MSTQRSRRSAIVAASVLATVTLGLFYVLQYQGPESVVWRFVGKVSERSAPGVAPLLVEPIGDPYAAAQVRLVSSILGSGGRMSVISARQLGAQAEVKTIFRFPSGQTAGLRWYLRKDNARWRVDATATVDGMRMP